MKLTPHQNDFIKRRDEGNSYLVAPPGSGKTGMTIQMADDAVRAAHGHDCGHLIVLVVINASAVKELAMMAECTLDHINSTIAQKGGKGRTALLLTSGTLFWRSFIPRDQGERTGRLKWKLLRDCRHAFSDCNQSGVQTSVIIDECHRLTASKVPKMQVLSKIFPWLHTLGMTGTDTFLSTAQLRLYRRILRPGGGQEFSTSSLKLIMTEEEYVGIQRELPINPEIQTVQLVGIQNLSPMSQTAHDVALLLSLLSKYKEFGLPPPLIHNCMRMVLQDHNDEAFFAQLVEKLNNDPFVKIEKVHDMSINHLKTANGFYFQSAISSSSIPRQMKELAFAIENMDDSKFENSLLDEIVRGDRDNLQSIVGDCDERGHCVVITGNASGSNLRKSMMLFKEQFEKGNFDARFKADFFDATRSIGSFKQQVPDIYKTVYSKKVAFVFANASIATSTNYLVGPVTAVASRGLLSESGARQLKGRISLRPIMDGMRPTTLYFFETVSRVLSDVNDFLKNRNEMRQQSGPPSTTRGQKRSRYGDRTPEEIEEQFPLGGQLNYALRHGCGIKDLLNNKAATKQMFESLKKRLLEEDDTYEEEEGMEREDGLQSDVGSE